MSFARSIWDSIISEMTLEVPTMTLRVVTRTESTGGVETHLLSLVGVSNLKVANTLPLPMSIAEIRDFGVQVGHGNRVVVTFEVSDQATFEVECASAHFDGVTFGDSSLS
jgi:hypothetical protein